MTQRVSCPPLVRKMRDLGGMKGFRLGLAAACGSELSLGQVGGKPCAMPSFTSRCAGARGLEGETGKLWVGPAGLGQRVLLFWLRAPGDTWWALKSREELSGCSEDNGLFAW